MTDPFVRMPLSSDQVRSLSQGSEFLGQVVRDRLLTSASLTTLFTMVRATNHVRNTTDFPPPLMLLPLSEDCILELVRGHLGSLILPFEASDGDDSFASCLHLLPDHARERDVNSSEYYCTYYAFAMEEAASSTDAAVYLAQTTLNITDPKHSLSDQEKAAKTFRRLQQCSHERDQYYLTTLLRAYSDGFKLERTMELLPLPSKQCVWRSCCRAAAPSLNLCDYHTLLTRSNQRGKESKANAKDDELKDIELEQLLADFIERTRRGVMAKEFRSIIKEKRDSLYFAALLMRSSDLVKRRVPEWGALKEPGAFERLLVRKLQIISMIVFQGHRVFDHVNRLRHESARFRKASG